MCGHFGMMGLGVLQDDINFIRDLAYVSGLRGMDGAGVCQGSASRYTKLDYFVEKSDYCIPDFLWFCEFGQKPNKRVLNKISDNFFIGHVRAATVGKICDRNSHPFDFNNIVGAHNGTLYEEKYLQKNKKKTQEITDSELMFIDMDNRGIIPVLSDLKPQSAYAVVILDKKTGEISFARNKHRDLVFAINDKRSVMYWASEPYMLRLCAERRKISLFENRIFRFSENMLYSIHPLDVRAGQTINWDKTRIKVQEEEKVKEEKQKGGKNNVVPLLINQTKKEKKPRFLEKCMVCSKELTLVDQYFSKKAVGFDAYVCVDCDGTYSIKVN